MYYVRWHAERLSSPSVPREIQLSASLSLSLSLSLSPSTSVHEGTVMLFPEEEGNLVIVAMIVK